MTAELSAALRTVLVTVTACSAPEDAAAIVLTLSGKSRLPVDWVAASRGGLQSETARIRTSGGFVSRKRGIDGVRPV
jgi:hypothetical protein